MATAYAHRAKGIDPGKGFGSSRICVIIWFFMLNIHCFWFQVSGVRNESQMVVVSFAIISAGYGGLLGRNAIAEY